MNYFSFVLLGLFSLSLLGCSGERSSENTTAADTTAQAAGEVNVYTHRHYESDQELFRRFEQQTGIKVNVVSASADELIQRLQMEGQNSPADVLITVDGGRLWRAKSQGLLSPVQSKVLTDNIPAPFRDKEGQWFGLTYRARILAYDSTRIRPGQLATYADLANPRFKGQILVRSSDNLYNQSLLASIIAHEGSEAALRWAKGVVANMARQPKGNDRDQVKTVTSGQGSIAIVNSYYIGNMLASEDAAEAEAGRKVKVFFPNQEGRGTHINVSGGGVTRHAPNRQNAIKFLEYLSSDEAQQVFAQANYEYPVKEGVAWSPTLQKWGRFKADTLDLEALGRYNAEAVTIFDKAGWK
ncbi:Fe(3+) ABC transporter substrate-binding protein [Cesiribacter andamanensis]|uniref:Iron uptake protein A1 n=1 Tax=Cesiribacter andamanensis AMV16 TaxID=1279009 RepID=M7NVC5_9BACT|nr:Fe(3+) ABC transporter substrate-binding protein [Cesiribacter andamanensis]EMR02414.1 Iron uptake protein A1 precursor [Cesiribacter andamanensis AMV16]